MTPHTNDRNGPTGDPSDIDDGNIYIYSEDDIDQITREAYAWIRELPMVTDEDAEEIATMYYELLTGRWSSRNAE